MKFIIFLIGPKNAFDGNTQKLFANPKIIISLKILILSDLAARNVLIDNNKTLKISDFGLSRHGIYTNTKTRKVRPLRWLSIEAIRDNVYSSKSDIWAYGVVLWEIGTLGASPYPTISNSELIPFLLAGNRLERPEICTPQVYTIMLQCWLEEPEERPTFDALYKVLSPKTTYVDINSLLSCFYKACWRQLDQKPTRT